MGMEAILTCLGAFGLALFLGTLVEYWAHRAMHEWGFFYERHWAHHKANHAREWLWDAFFYYPPMALPLILLGYLGGWWFFLGWALGGLVYAFVMSLAHMVQHHHPRRVFWMRYPIHYLHHRFHKGRNNYGVVTCWWDRLFGTYHVPRFYVRECDARSG